MNNGLDLVMRAAAFAALKHCDQWRKGADPTPYINHPLDVARVLCEEGGVSDPEMLAAALLHDTIEDTLTVHDDLDEAFGARVAGLVAELTDDKRLPKRDRKRRQVTDAPHKSGDAQQIKLADKLCNLREILADPPARWSSARKQEYFDWAKSVVDSIREANPALAGAFDRAYAQRAELG